MEIEHNDVHTSLFFHNLSKARYTKKMYCSDTNLLVYRLLNELINDKKIDISNNEVIILYCSNGKIHDLDPIVHSRSTIDYLNNVGIKIYLMEPISFYIHEDTSPYKNKLGYNFGFFSEFPNSATSKYLIRSQELNSIVKYIEKNQLTNVSVHTCDKNIETHLLFYKNKINLVCDDIFLSTLKFYDNIEIKDKDEIKKKFISVNWRYSPHRAIICSFLNNKFSKDSYLTWYYRISEKVLNQSTWASKEEVIKYNADFYPWLNKLNRKSPFYLDIYSSKAVSVKENVAHYFPNFTGKKFDDGLNPVAYNQAEQNLQHYYNHTFVSIVNESRYAQPTANFSEKVIQPIIYRTPFVLVAPPLTLLYLKEHGYKTFSKWWDESYDLETNHLKRMKKIMDVIEEINSYSYSELYDIYIDMLSVLEHNLDNFLRTTKTVYKKHRSTLDTFQISWLPAKTKIE